MECAAQRMIARQGHAVARRLACARGIIAMLLLVACGNPSRGDAATATPELPPVRAGEDRVGIAAPALQVDDWIGEDPGTIEALRGRVVLLRFWTDTCPYCRASAPALVALDHELADRGLVVLAIHHPKPRGVATDREQVARVAAEYGFDFPVGLDEHWRTIDSWWLDSGEREATSATLLVDRRGIVRWVHPGPEYHPGGPADHERCRSDFADLRAAALQLLSE